jgi:hypothetical protein
MFTATEEDKLFPKKREMSFKNERIEQILKNE